MAVNIHNEFPAAGEFFYIFIDTIHETRIIKHKEKENSSLACCMLRVSCIVLCVATRHYLLYAKNVH